MMTTADNLLENTDNVSWNCFVALEEELEATLAFIALHKKNYHLSSEKYQSIILKACAEIENIYKVIGGKVLETRSDIASFIGSITEHHHDFFNTEILMPNHDEVIKPWHVCAEGKTPSFWSAYNAIKHEGAMEKATLEHAIHSMAGLFSLLLAWD